MCSAVSSSITTCVITEWSVLVGYTIVLCPILIKVGAINKLTRYAKRFRRLEIDGKKLRRYPVYVMIPVIIYLVAWTAVDIPKPTETLSMGTSGIGNTIVVNTYCSSQVEYWSLVAYIWQVLMLLSATVLAFQSSDVVEEMNERQLGFLVYSQFIFLALRIAIVVLTRTGTFPGSFRSPIVSIVLSVDVMTGTMIYIGPKVYTILTSSDKNNQSTSSTASSWRTSSRKSEFPGGKESFLSSYKSVLQKFSFRKSTKADRKEDPNVTKGVMDLRKSGVLAIKSVHEISSLTNTGTEESKMSRMSSSRMLGSPDRDQFKSSDSSNHVPVPTNPRRDRKRVSFSMNLSERALKEMNAKESFLSNKKPAMLEESFLSNKKPTMLEESFLSNKKSAMLEESFLSDKKPAALEDEMNAKESFLSDKKPVALQEETNVNESFSCDKKPAALQEEAHSVSKSLTYVVEVKSEDDIKDVEEGEIVVDYAKPVINIVQEEVLDETAPLAAHGNLNQNMGDN